MNIVLAHRELIVVALSDEMILICSQTRNIHEIKFSLRQVEGKVKLREITRATCLTYRPGLLRKLKKINLNYPNIETTKALQMRT